MKPNFLLVLLALVFTATTLTAISLAEEESAPEGVSVSVESALRIGPFAAQLPAFHDKSEHGFSHDDLANQGPVSAVGLTPRAGDRIQSALAERLAWKITQASKNNFVLGKPSSEPMFEYLAFYAETDRWQSVTLELTSVHPVQAFLDGQSVSLKKQEADDDQAPQHTGTLKLETGKHVVMIQTLSDPDTEDRWQVAAKLTLAAEIPAESLILDTAPDRAVTIDDILDAPRINSAAISPDGKMLAVRLSEYGPSGSRDSWLEIRGTRDGRLQKTWRGDLSIGRVQWAPKGFQLSYTTSDDGKTTLWLHDIQTGETRHLLRDIEHMGGYQWAPDGSFVIYSINVDAEPDSRDVRRVAHPADRWPWSRDRSYLMQVSVPDGITRRLTAGPLSPNSWSISPDSKQMLFFLSEPDFANRPYSTSELWQMDLTTLATELLLTDPWIGGATYGPNPGILALQGSPSAFDGLGSTLPDGVQPNDYGGQLYLFDLKTKTPRAVSRHLRPDISGIDWSLHDGKIYARCTDTQYANVYSYDTRKETWTKIDTGVEYTERYDLARTASIGLAYGTSATTPNRLYAIDLATNRSCLLLDPDAEAYRNIQLGTVEDWACKLPNGEILDGRVYFPLHFDRSQKYPLIVYYYGGTSPVTRDYGGRYPKNVWAGQDFIIYVPNPSGATGYGQEFAARHVNDWGKLTGTEVIEGTKAFLTAHPYADPDKVGCIGASYGGFLTEYVVTRTDIFAAAISHAGISSISSYWGEGYWGYLYGARALANAFPWQDRELYVEQSPLFSADKINTPLLLLHGDADTNVPVGESDQLFIALKLLGREVEYVQIQNQNHHILNHDQRIVWNDTILAWFAKWLKDRPAWWEELYPDSVEKETDDTE